LPSIVDFSTEWWELVAFAKRGTAHAKPHQWVPSEGSVRQGTKVPVIAMHDEIG
jgi:hypothetical protein